jgi:hypothetical protein
VGEVPRLSEVVFTVLSSFICHTRGRFLFVLICGDVCTRHGRYLDDPLILIITHTELRH